MKKIMLVRSNAFSCEDKIFLKGETVDVADKLADYLLKKIDTVFVEGEGIMERQKFIEIKETSKKDKKGEK